MKTESQEMRIYSFLEIRDLKRKICHKINFVRVRLVHILWYNVQPSP